VVSPNNKPAKVSGSDDDENESDANEEDEEVANKLPITSQPTLTLDRYNTQDMNAYMNYVVNDREEQEDGADGDSGYYEEYGDDAN